jgi:Na+/H+ antiporter NhaD/arsenite permease-like protein
MDLDVILFLVGMMVLVGVLRESGFFRWLVCQVLRVSRFRPYLLLVLILIMSSITAALVDEVTSMLFMSALVLDLCDFFRVNPTKYIISVVLMTNIGSSWTVLGNPIGILIALRSGLTFIDFVRFPLVIGVISLCLLIPIILFWMRKDIRELESNIILREKESILDFLDTWAHVKDRGVFIGSMVIFFTVVLLLVIDHQLEIWFGLPTNTLLFATPIFGAGIVMLWKRDKAQEYIQKDVDWWTLVFFMFLFAKAGALHYVGLTNRISNLISGLSGYIGSYAIQMSILWLSGFTSSIVDNVVAVAALIPVAQNLSNTVGSVIWWALLFGGTYGGNLTMVGSTANIVALGILEKRVRSHVTLWSWLKIGFWGFLIPMATATVALIL